MRSSSPTAAGHDPGRAARRSGADLVTAPDRGRRTPASGSRPRRRSGSSSASPRPTSRPRGAMAAPASGSPSPVSWPGCSAARWSVESAPGVGSCFRFERPSPAARTAPRALPGGWCWSARRAAAAAYRRRLAGWGVDVVVATSAGGGARSRSPRPGGGARCCCSAGARGRSRIGACAAEVAGRCARPSR